MHSQGYVSANQQMGLRWAIGCVALEITQRCNLDCTLCYLSEYSESVHDIPLAEIFHRIDQIHQYYGENTDIQVTGGDPTLREQTELVQIIRYIKNKNMRSTLMTNGIRARRPLLAELARAGLNDVAFHVDMTQERNGYNSEVELNVVRQKYIDRAKGLGLSVVFNTTVYDRNFHEIQDLVRFFVQNSKFVRTASFQLQADTGRGIDGKRDVEITADSVWEQIESACKTTINYKSVRTGHPECNRYGMTAVINNSVFDIFDDEKLTGSMQVATKQVVADRNKPFRTVAQTLFWGVKNPGECWIILRWILSRLQLLSGSMLKHKTTVSTLSFFLHNFMDACDLDSERVKACVFKNMTREGPVSMCEYNARRNDFILSAVPLKEENTVKFWDPLSNQYSNMPIQKRKQADLIKYKRRLKDRSNSEVAG